MPETQTPAPTLACLICHESQQLEVEVAYDGRVAQVVCKVCRAKSFIQLPQTVPES